VFGNSFGATVALAAAPTMRNLRRLVLYGPSPAIEVVAGEDVARIEALVDAGQRGEALAAAYAAFGLTTAEVAHIRDSPVWAARVAAVHTVVRELRAEADYRVEPERFAELEVPVLLLRGEESPAWAREGADRIQAAIPNAQLRVLPGQGHVAILTAPELVAGELLRFLRA
jgi:pimeloyl-ACP methyl ester carboxylesterase